MAITTRIATLYGGQKLFAAALCAIFGVWGAYDYFIKIPDQEQKVQEFAAITTRLKELENHTLTSAEETEVLAAVERLKVIAPNNEAPVAPSKFDRATQWVFIACLPFTPWFLWLFMKAKKQKYTLDDEGTLHFAGDPEHQSGAWKQEEIVDIDMNRWMAKSIAYAVHTNGTRLKLDAYLHKDLHLIIGAIANRFYPDQWDVQAKKVKSPEGEQDGADASAETVEQ